MIDTRRTSPPGWAGKQHEQRDCRHRPGFDRASHRSVLDPYRDSAAAIEASNLDYTILRPGWFTHEPAVHYLMTRKGEPFKGHDVSLNSLSDLIVKLCTAPGLHIRVSFGVSGG